jgi:hypothetical protein
MDNLRDLVEQWRERALKATWYNPDIEDADHTIVQEQELEKQLLNDCADELEKAING